MNKPRLTQLAHDAVEKRLQDGAIAVDATVGNGLDTAFLAQHVGAQGHVYGFDPQASALSATALRLTGQQLLQRVTLIHAGHETMQARLHAAGVTRVQAIMFNLGYLPGGDKRLVTQPATTLQALQQAVTYMHDGACISIVAYPGHTGGAEEWDAVKAWLNNLNTHLFDLHTQPAADSPRAPVWLFLHKRRLR